MSYGITVKNNYEYIILDNNYKSYTLYDSGTATDMTNGINFIEFDNTGVNPISIDSTSINPIFVFSPSVGSAGAFSTFGNDGTNYTGVYMGFDGTGEIDWRVYTVISNDTPSNNGLVIYNNNNELTYNADKKNMEVPKIYNPSITEGVTITTTSGGYYYIEGYSYYYDITYNYGNSYIDIWAFGLKRNSATQLEIKKVKIFHEDFSSAYIGGISGEDTHFPGTLIEVI